MKKLVLVLSLVLVSNLVISQTVSITDSKLTISGGGEVDAFEVLIPNCKADDIQKAMEKWLKKYDGDVDNKKGEIKALHVLFKDFYNTPVTIYSRVESSGDDVKLKISVDAGGGMQSIKSQPDIYQKFKDAIRTFSVNEAKEAAQQRLNEAQKQLKSLSGELSDLKKENDHLQKEINDCNATIEKNKESIKTVDINQKEKTSEVNDQTQKVNDLQKQLNGIQ